MIALRWLCVACAFALLVVINPARANLIGPGNTVNALFYPGTLSPTDVELQTNATTGFVGPSLIGIAGTSFTGAQSASTSDVGTDPGHSKVIITNESSLPFCFGPQCPNPDAFDGFEFIFTGTDITGVTVDPATAGDFEPVTPPMFTAATQDILVNITNDNPAVGDQLILDLMFPGGTTPVPEPPTLSLLATALLACLAMRHRKKRRWLHWRPA